MTTSLPTLEYKDAAIGLVPVTVNWGRGAPGVQVKASPAFDLDADPDGTAWAVVAVTGIRDDVDDVIVPGAFRRSLKVREMKGVLGHDWNRPVAVQREAMELMPGDPRLPATLADGITPWPKEAGALLVKAAYILATSDGRDAWEQAKAFGATQAYSIGYKVAKARERGGVRYIYDLDVYEFSPVLHGANRLATLQAVKSGHVADIEHADADDLVERDEPVTDDELAATTYLDDTEEEEKGLIRRVKNSAFWGLPKGTRITRRMRPRRRRGQGAGGPGRDDTWVRITPEQTEAAQRVSLSRARTVAERFERPRDGDLDATVRSVSRDDALAAVVYLRNMSGDGSPGKALLADDVEAALRRVEDDADSGRLAPGAEYPKGRRVADDVAPGMQLNYTGDDAGVTHTVDHVERGTTPDTVVIVHTDGTRAEFGTQEAVRVTGGRKPGAGQSKSAPTELEISAALDWTSLTEFKARRGPRRVVDAAYWGRPVGTLITPGMKPAGPRARAGGPDRGTTGQRGVGGGMGRAGVGGIRRDTSAGIRARQGRRVSDYSDSHAEQRAVEVAGRLRSGDASSVDDLPEGEVDAALRQLRYSPSDTVRDKAHEYQAMVDEHRRTSGKLEVRDGESRQEARARAASVGNVEQARANVAATIEQAPRDRWGEPAIGYGQMQNLRILLDKERPAVASADGRVMAVDRGQDQRTNNELGWAVFDAATGDILSKSESHEDVGEFVEGAADRLVKEDDRGGSTGGDGGAALRDAPAQGAGGDSGEGSTGVLRGAGDGGERGDRGPGGGAGGAGRSGGDVSGAAGSADRGAAERGVDGDQGDDSARSGRGGAAADSGAGGAGQRGAGRPGGAGGGDAERGSDGVLGGARGADDDQLRDTLKRGGGDGSGTGEALSADDAGAAPFDVDVSEVPTPDLVAAQRLDAIPDGDDFRPAGPQDLAPAGARAKLAANMDALRTLRRLQFENPPRAATAPEQLILAKWAGWGGLPKVFDDDYPEYAAERSELRGMLSESEWNEARRNTLNAHYTDGRVSAAVWDALADLGFSGGRVLEPGSGSGNFIGFAPESASMVGVELDSTTAGISKYLYPNAAIRNESFARTRMPEDSFDAAVGNVPFGRYSLLDPKHNPDGESIHNHFINKSLRLTRPGGIVAVLTSRFTMDAQDSSARERMAERADLLGAVRLPTGSHQAAAGTDVIEDLLIFRVREDGAEPGDQSWVKASKVDVNGFELSQSDYFTAHPENVLGEVTAEKGRFGTGDLIVRGDRDMGGLATALSGITDAARADGRTQTDRDAPLPELLEADSTRHEGHMQQEPDGSFTQAQNGVSSAIEIPKAQRAEVGSLLKVRDALRALLREEGATAEDTPKITALRAELNAAYDAHVRKYGPVNRFTMTANGARKNPPASLAFRRDPSSAIVRALETYDGTSGTAVKAAVFQKRANAPRKLAVTADNPADAISLSMETYGEVDLPAIATMMGVDEPEARARLGTLVHEVPPLTFEQEEAAVRIDRAVRADGDAADIDPDDLALIATIGDAVGSERGELEPAAVFLSGNVRRKLAIARAAAKVDSRFRGSVEALEAVQPADIDITDIDARLGAVWIDAKTVEEFVRSLLGSGGGYGRGKDAVKVRNAGSVWTVEGPKVGTLATEQWGTPERPAPQLIQAVLEQRPIRITSKVDGKTIPDVEATLAAQAKAEEIQEAFQEWIWDDPDRARRLSAAYNDSFNGIALRSYDGAKRTFPGMAAGFQPRPHQVAAVERIVSEPTALLGHVVGAGKTAEMVMGTAELKRLGMARKPAIVVPNHMLDQFTKEYLEVYPNANLLAAGSDDLGGDKRREFAARAATGDWDAVILTQGAFESIPMSPDRQQEYVDRELGEMRAALEEAKAQAGAEGDDKSKTVKEMEKQIQSAETALEKLLAKGAKTKDSDGGITFEETGIDYLMIDEAHHYSNLRTVSRIANSGTTGSGKATDLHMKMEYLRSTNESGRVATFATGTPIRNTVTQAYIMQKFLRPDLLQEAGITSFDQWAATFGTVVEEMELKPEGSGFRMSSRFAKFRNVPELLRIFHTFADIKLAEDLKLPTPNIVGGRAQNVIVPASDELRAYIGELGERADLVRSGGVDPEDDNMLSISMDGRKAALSMELVGGQHQPGKIEAAADKIAAIHAETANKVFPANPRDPDAGDHPTPGALQIVFLDLGTPNSDGRFDAYDKLRSELAARGIDPAKVRFMHEASNDAQKAEMFAQAKDGRINVIIGSTEKMGTGTNIQARAVALHHLDAPWRPSDVEQRDGRIVRQGNMNTDVQVLRYVTEESFDAYMWQTLERKAKFINQIMKGSLDVREIEDVGDTAMSYAEIKALATGNPDLLAKAKVDTLYQKLRRLKRAHDKSQKNMTTNIGLYTTRATTAEANAEKIAAAIETRVDTRGDAFAITVLPDPDMDVEGGAFTKRADAGTPLGAALAQAARKTRRGWREDQRQQTIAEIGGHQLRGYYEDDRKLGPVLVLRFDGIPGDVVKLRPSDLASETIGASTIARAENFLADLDGRRVDLLDRAEADRAEIERMSARVGQRFGKENQLFGAMRKSERIQKKMELDADRAKMLGSDWRAIIGDPDRLEAARADRGYDQGQIGRLKFDDLVDTDRFDDPSLGRDDVADAPPEIVVPPAPELEREVDAPTAREPELDLARPDTAPAPTGLSAGALDAARADADAALSEGDAGALTTALGRMGVPESDNPRELADTLLTLPDARRTQLLDRIESTNAADDQYAAVTNQQAQRALGRPADAEPEPSPGEASVPQFASRGDLLRFISGNDTAANTPLIKFFRSNNGPEGFNLLSPEQQRMVLAAIAGRGRNSNEFDLAAARAALVRLADDDPTLPANAIGRRVQIEEADPADDSLRYEGGRPVVTTRPVTGRVVEVHHNPGATVRVVIERDNPGPDDTPRAVATMRADAELLLTEDDDSTPATITAADRELAGQIAAEPGPALIDVPPASDGPAPEVSQGDEPDVGATAAPAVAGGPPVAFSELTRGTWRAIGAKPGDRVAYSYVSPRGRDQRQVRTGTLSYENGSYRLTPDGGTESFDVGANATVVHGAVLDGNGRALQRGEVTTAARNAAPTPETSRARTNRINAAAERVGGQGGAGSRRVVNGSVHQVYADANDPAAVAKVTDALNALGWEGAVVTNTGRTHDWLGERRVSIEMRVPDIGADGRPMRTFGPADSDAGAPSVPDAPEETDGPDFSSISTDTLRSVQGDAARRAQQMRTARDNAGLDEDGERTLAALESNERLMGDEISRRELSGTADDGREPAVEPAVSNAENAEQARLSAEDVAAAADVPAAGAAPQTGRLDTAEDPAGVTPLLSDAELDATRAEYERRAGALGRPDAVNRAHRAVLDEQARRAAEPVQPDVTPDELAAVQGGDVPDAPAVADVAEPAAPTGPQTQSERRALMEATLGAAMSRVLTLIGDLSPRDDGTAVGADRVAKGRRINVPDTSIRGEARELDRLAQQIDDAGDADTWGQWYAPWPRQLREAAAEIRRETGGDDTGQPAAPAADPRYAELNAMSLDELRGLVAELGTPEGTDRQYRQTARARLARLEEDDREQRRVAAEQTAATDRAAAEQARVAAENAELAGAAAGHSFLPVAGRMRELLQMKINDGMESDDDDFFGGKLNDDGRLEVFDRERMLATIEDELDILEGNLRGPGRVTGDPEYTRTKRREEQAWRTLQARVQALPQQPAPDRGEQAPAPEAPPVPAEPTATISPDLLADAAGLDAPEPDAPAVPDTDDEDLFAGSGDEEAARAATGGDEEPAAAPQPGPGEEPERPAPAPEPEGDEEPEAPAPAPEPEAPADEEPAAPAADAGAGEQQPPDEQPDGFKPGLRQADQIEPGMRVDLGQPEPDVIAAVEDDPDEQYMYVETVDGDRVEMRRDDWVNVLGRDEVADGPDEGDEPAADDAELPDEEGPDFGAGAPEQAAPEQAAPDEAPEAGTPVPDAATPPAPAAPEATVSPEMLAEIESIEADALGIVEADDGEIEVTAEVADRQTRVEGLLTRAASGELDVSAQTDSELTSGRRDLVDELRLQESLARRDRQRARERTAAQPAAPVEPVEPVEGADVPDADAPEAAAVDVPEPTPEPAAPTLRPGLAGAAEDLADAVEGGDPAAIEAARARALSSLARVRVRTAAHDELDAELANPDGMDAERLRSIAEALRAGARARRNSQARDRRLAKRLERERLRSLIGTYDAELRQRGQDPDSHGGPVPPPTRDDQAVENIGDGGDTADGGGPGGATGSGTEQDAPAAGPGPDASGSGSPDPAPAYTPSTFDRSNPDGPAGQARTTELVDGLVSQPWRLMARPSALFADLDEGQIEARKAAARKAFGPLLDTFGPAVRRRDNETLETAARLAKAQAARLRGGEVADLATLTFAMLLPTAQRRPFMEALRSATLAYTRESGGAPLRAQAGAR